MSKKRGYPAYRKHPSKKERHGGHFIIPEFLGGQKTEENVYRPWAGHEHPQHVAWHQLFGHNWPEEAINTIRLWTRRNGQLNMRYFLKPNGETNVRYRAWKTLFDDMTPAEAIAWIKREFIRKEWLRE